MVRPPTFPADASRVVRVDVARGSMPYSAVTHPLPLPRRNGGTRSSTLAAQMTRVRPTSISTDPSACKRKFGVRTVGRSSCGARSFWRIQTLIFAEWPPQVHMTGERVDFMTVDQQLHLLHVCQLS